MTRTRIAVAVLLATVVSGVHAHPQTFQIGIIDFYGLGKIPASDARAALAFKEGDPVEFTDRLPAVFKTSEDRLTKLAGVASAHVHPVCCEAGRVIVYVGIEERGAPVMRLRTAPQGTERLPDDVVQAGEAFSRAFTAAVERGHAAEDRSQGHSLFQDPATRGIQEQFVTFARRDLAQLRRVLSNSADAGQRALAAQVLGYAENKQDVVDDLVRAMSDPSDQVRNSAMRALMVFAEAAANPGGVRVHVPVKPFIDFLNSNVWSDRNKAALALQSLTVPRDPAVLSELRQSALPPLVDMARWKSAGHAQPGFMILARIAGFTDDDAHRRWEQGDRETVIAAALRGGTGWRPGLDPALQSGDAEAIPIASAAR